jgi:hypothetical protein
MVLLFWDASALVKRYYPELGSQSVDLMIAGHTAHSMATTPWGYIETFSILLRRFNGGVIDSATFADAISALQAEVIQNPVFLTVLVEYAHLPSALSCCLISSDHRFLRAAAAEGIATINPETIAPSDVLKLMSSL